MGCTHCQPAQERERESSMQARRWGLTSCRHGFCATEFAKSAHSKYCRGAEQAGGQRAGQFTNRRDVMPYILGWFMGVPLIVLVLLYLIFH